MQFQGIENVDPSERARQHTLTKALWATLEERKFGSDTTGRIVAFLKAAAKDDAVNLVAHYDPQEDWNSMVVGQSDSGEYIVEVVSPECQFSLAAFIDLADLLMIDAVAFNARFDGFEVRLDSVQKHPWWKFWR